MGSSTPSQLREIRSSFKMPPITDDEVIDAAAAEKTEDATDGKAAEAEAKEEAVEEKKEEEATVQKSNPKDGVISLYTTKNEKSHTENSPNLSKKIPRKKFFYLSSISIKS